MLGPRTEKIISYLIDCSLELGTVMGTTKDSDYREERKRIWLIEPLIKELTEVCEALLDYFEGKDVPDERIMALLLMEAKNISSYVEMAHTQLYLCSSGKRLGKELKIPDTAKSVRGFLKKAKGSLEETLDGLGLFHDEESIRFQSQVRMAFEKCQDKISEELKRIVGD